MAAAAAIAAANNHVAASTVETQNATPSSALTKSVPEKHLLTSTACSHNQTRSRSKSPLLVSTDSPAQLAVPAHKDVTTSNASSSVDSDNNTISKLL